MRKVTAYVMTAVVCAILLAGTGTAHAVLRALGPVNQATGFPFWYQDTNGLALSLCLDQNGFCLLPAVFVYPTNRTAISAANFPVESFYYMADTSGTSPGGTINLILYEAAVEAGFIGVVTDGGQAAFTRIRIRADVTVLGTYRVVHPYGEQTYEVTAIGNGTEINDTVDVPGLVLAPFDQNHPSLAGTPPILPQNVGPFLTRADGVILTDPLNPNNKYIGLPGQQVAVTGSPTGNNFVRITGPGNDEFLSTTFGLMGKVVGLEVTPQAGADFGVWKVASPSTPVTFTVTNRTGIDIPARNTNVNPPLGVILTPGSPVFTIPAASDTCADGISAVAPGDTCTFDVVFTPAATEVSTSSISIANPASPTFTVPVTGTGDGVAPILAAGPDLFTKTVTATISGTASDNIGVPTLQVSLNGVIQGTPVLTDGTWTFDLTGLTLNAANSVSVTASDTALPAPGNQTTDLVTITHDDILPVVNLTSPVAGVSSNNAPVLSFNVTETNPAVDVVKLNGAVVTPAPATLGPLADGQHTLTVESTDKAGNLGVATTVFTVDTILPDVAVSSPAPVSGRLGNPNPTLAFIATDANAVTTVVSVNGSVIANPVSGVTKLGPFAAGDNVVLSVVSTDPAGNSTTRTVNFTINFADGRITSLGAAPASIADALAALRHVVNLAPLAGDQFAHADVAPLDVNGLPNPDNSVDISDALVILRRVVGLITTF